MEAAPDLKPKPAGPCVLVVFGVTGDLTKRLLAPALYNLARERLLPEEFAIAGFAMDDWTQDAVRDRIAQNLKEQAGDSADAAAIEWLTSRVVYVRSTFDDPAGFEQLKQKLEALDQQYRTGGNYLFYFAIPPEFFLEVAQRVSAVGLLREQDGRWRRMVVEKPFGHDLNSARELNRALTALVRDDQIYRIDHYLGKETVQNVLVFRFANGVFEPIWNRRYVDHVQITVAETVGVELRGSYYDHTGALRDMVPNHLLQLLTLTAMEPPSSFMPHAFHNEQVKVLEAVPPSPPGPRATSVIRGQYASGTIGGKPVVGYRQEPNVAPDSVTETYIALKLAIDNWRWAGVPFYLRTGKRLRLRESEVTVQFRNPPLSLFRKGAVSLPEANRIVIRVQPDESILLAFEAKVPGPVVQIKPVAMRFCYRDYFGRENRTGYETLLYDAMIGDSSLFKRTDIIEAGWAVVQPILDAWQQSHGEDLCMYPAGSDGPPEADEMIQRDGRAWRPLGSGSPC